MLNSRWFFCISVSLHWTGSTWFVSGLCQLAVRVATDGRRKRWPSWWRPIIGVRERRGKRFTEWSGVTGLARAVGPIRQGLWMEPSIPVLGRIHQFQQRHSPAALVGYRVSLNRTEFFVTRSHPSRGPSVPVLSLLFSAWIEFNKIVQVRFTVSFRGVHPSVFVTEPLRARTSIPSTKSNRFVLVGFFFKSL